MTADLWYRLQWNCFPYIILRLQNRQSIYLSIFVDHSLLLLCHFHFDNNHKKIIWKLVFTIIIMSLVRAFVIKYKSPQHGTGKILGKQQDFQSACKRWQSQGCFSISRRVLRQKGSCTNENQAFFNVINTILITSRPICLSYKSKWASMSFITLGST